MTGKVVILRVGSKLLMALISNPEPSTFTEEERAAVHEQLERLLANPFFSHSRRFPALLRFVVETTLDGRSHVLKERTLGVEVFGKSSQYDTSNDPIVRVTAAEIRKRIALYYGEPGHESELRLSLPSGSYVPHFDWPRLAAVESETELDHRVPTKISDIVANSPSSPIRPDFSLVAEPVSQTARSLTPGDGAGRTTTRRKLRVALVVIAVIAFAGACFGLYRWRLSAGSPLQTFWSPLLSSPDPVLFCVADQTEYTDIQLRDAADPTRQSVLHDSLTAVVIDDLAPIVGIAGILRQNGKAYTVRGEGVTTLNDLRSSSTVFIGAYDNGWTLRLLQPLRFHFANSPDMTNFSIADSSSSKPTSWQVNRREQIATNNYRDYAIVARFTDSNTGRLAVVVAGIGRGGTIAAGEFLTTPALLNQVRALVQSPEKRNIEIVLSTQIIGGQPGTPRVEASYSW